MGTLFPPGGASLLPMDREKSRSPWREFEFVLSVMMQAILPIISLKEIMEKWKEIAANLSDPPRKRTKQLYLAGFL